jgi:hypothetical protein
MNATSKSLLKEAQQHGKLATAPGGRLSHSESRQEKTSPETLSQPTKFSNTQPQLFKYLSPVRKYHDMRINSAFYKGG